MAAGVEEDAEGWLWRCDGEGEGGELKLEEELEELDDFEEVLWDAGEDEQ